jgi:valyl-tRNA synthetase
MSISAKYEHSVQEEKWYQFWQDQGFFKSTPNERKAYTIVVPPPNVTGVLHMGHMLNNTLQDVLIRKARMQGYNACWVPGTDHASIATEAKVVQKLKAEGINKFDLSREEFLEHAWEWTHKHGGIIQQQLKKLGCSFDWSREAFTMDEVRSESVLQVFVDLFNKGLIYRGYRMVNWDPEAKTTLSDEEVLHKDVQAKLYYVKYKMAKADGFMTVATTRPETILGDVAICVNPNDERYKTLIGQRAIVPIAGREIPIIADEYVDLEFGTGCLKITPAHDINDYTIGQKHNLEIIDVLNEDGTLNEHGGHYQGQDRFAVRKAIAKELEENGALVKIEDYQTSVGTSERTGAVIEPRLSDQWFLKMKDLAQPALEAILAEDADIKLIPEKFKNTYRHWMENVIDWNISRQLWWGHQIPAWYYGPAKEDFVVALSAEEALELARQKTKNPSLALEDLRQEEDVLDTWFSSWLWPISVFDGIRNPENEEINYYYPTRDLITAPEILFFWVARMIMVGYEYRKQKPFSHVYLTGIVRDKQGRKMSKQLGNSPDPIQLMNTYSTDGVRVGMLLTSPAGNDLPFDEDLCVQGRNFTNKLWNALRLVKGWEVVDEPVSAEAQEAIAWFTQKRLSTLESLEKSFADYRISEALMTLYKFTWDDFCNWYLEAVKPAYQKPISQALLAQTVQFFEEVVEMLHPFMPFITEEIWQLLKLRQAGESICIAAWPKAEKADAIILENFDQALAIVNGIRNIRAEKNIAKKDALDLQLPSGDALAENLYPLVQKLANLKTIGLKADAEVAAGFTFLAGKFEFFVPAGAEIDLEVEKAKLEKELVYLQGFIKSVEKKLANERFVNNAPEAVVNVERTKKADAEAKINALQDSLKTLGA